MADGLEAIPRDPTEEGYADGKEPTPMRNLRRLRKQTVESNVVDVPVELKKSDTEDSGNSALTGSLKVSQILKDISNGVSASKAKSAKATRQSTLARDGSQKPGPHRRSKRLLARPTGIQGLNGGETDADVFEDSPSSSEDEVMLVPKRSKCLRKKHASEYASGEVGEDNDTWQNSSD
ncbi:hypothetical protein U9M48_016947, partial [Paspalum notatum var. saurae]